jgi:hypothetical protein
MRTIRNILAIAAALAAFLFAGLPATAGSMRCTNLQAAIDATLAANPTAIVHRMTAEDAGRFGPADAGAWFEMPGEPTVYVLFARAGCVRASRQYMRAIFDRLRAGDK